MQKHLPKGAFLLLEFCIYSALFLLIGTLTLKAGGQLYSFYMRLCSAAYREIEVANAHDLLFKDVWHTRENTLWDSSAGVWRCYRLCKEKLTEESYDVGWQMYKGKLCRLVGWYDFVHKVWQKKVRQVVTDAFLSIAVMPLNPDQTTPLTVMVTYCLKGENNEKKWYFTSPWISSFDSDGHYGMGKRFWDVLSSSSQYDAQTGTIQKNVR